MNCANCESPAVYIYDPKPLAPTPYCSAHLPSFLKQAAKAGSLPTTEAFTEKRDAALSSLKPRRRRSAPKEAAAEEAPQPEPEVQAEPEADSTEE
jgi:hypothetical protein